MAKGLRYTLMVCAILWSGMADAATCTVPNAITNGQVADASKVMENFNAVASCVDAANASSVTTTGTVANGSLAVFSGAKSIASGDLSGDVTTSGTTVTTLAPSGVTPGTYVNATITVDAKGRVTSANTGASGSSSSSVDYFNGYTLPVPVISNFTVTADPSFGNNYGLQTASTGVSLYGGNNTFAFAWADETIPGGGTTGDFSVTGLIKMGYPSIGNYAVGITLGDGSRRIVWGYRNSELWMSHDSGTSGNDAISQYGGDVGVISSPTLFRIRRTGGTIYFEIALDGQNFDTIVTEPASAYLSSNLTTFGIGILPNATFQRIVCYGLVGQ